MHSIYLTVSPLYVFSTLKGGVDVLSTCVGVTSSLTAAEVALLTNAWAELLTPASVNDDTVRCDVCCSDLTCILVNKTQSTSLQVKLAVYFF